MGFYLDDIVIFQNKMPNISFSNVTILNWIFFQVLVKQNKTMNLKIKNQLITKINYY